MRIPLNVGFFLPGISGLETLFLRVRQAFGIVLPFGLLSILGRNVYAQEKTQDEVRVRGSQAGGFVTRADEATAPREVTDAASLVEALPGVHVRRLGGDDSFATLSIRGSSSTQVAVLLAGVPLSGGSDPSLDLASLPLWPGAHARVYRTFAPAALGPGSLGGTLAVDPPGPRDRDGYEAWGAVGSFGAARLRLGDVRSLDEAGRVRIATGLSASRASDDFTYLDPIASSPGHDVFRVHANAEHAAASGLTSLAIELAGGTRVAITALAQARRQGLPGSITLPTPFDTLATNRELASVWS